MAKGRKTGGGSRKGVPNKATAEIKDVAREFGPAAIAKAAELAGLVNDKPKAESEASQVAALHIILDRAYGKAPQQLDIDASVKAEITAIERRIVDPKH
jgi:hypothetical protein